MRRTTTKFVYVCRYCKKLYMHEPTSVCECRNKEYSIFSNKLKPIFDSIDFFEMTKSEYCYFKKIQKKYDILGCSFIEDYQYIRFDYDEELLKLIKNNVLPSGVLLLIDRDDIDNEPLSITLEVDSEADAKMTRKEWKDVLKKII